MESKYFEAKIRDQYFRSEISKIEILKDLEESVEKSEV